MGEGLCFRGTSPEGGCDSNGYCWRIRLGRREPGKIPSLYSLSCPGSGPSAAQVNSPAVSSTAQVGQGSCPRRPDRERAPVAGGGSESCYLGSPILVSPRAPAPHPPGP